MKAVQNIGMVGLQMGFHLGDGKNLAHVENQFQKVSGILPVELRVEGMLFFSVLQARQHLLLTRSIFCPRLACLSLSTASACLSFSMPLAGMLMAGKAAYHYETKGRHLESAAMAGAGGIAAIALGILGFFLGAIFLTIGLLVGRDSKKTA
jgi:hypothetical protein